MMTQKVQSAVMHALMKHGHSKTKKVPKKLAEAKEPKREVPDDEEGEYESEPGESAYQRYKEPKLKGKKK